MVVTTGALIITNLLGALNSQVQPHWISHGTGNVAPVIGNTALGAEVDTRSVAVVSQATITVASDTMVLTGAAITAGGTEAIGESGVFDQLALGGHMLERTSFASLLNLVLNDTVTYTWKIQFTVG